MTTPTTKSPEIESLMTSIAGISLQDAHSGGICTICKLPVEGFRDKISTKEYSISGLCQKCQDSVFGGQDEE